jgi:ribosomal-protein-alanine N-acetyltransferase
MSRYTISPLSEECAQQIITWRYDPPYDLYDLSPADLSGLLTPANRYHQVLDRDKVMVGFCCFGEDAQVPGGCYDQGEPGVLDIGVGLRPDLTGKKLGKDFVAAVLEYAHKTYHPGIFRVSVASFNQRSLKTFQGLGFKVSCHFTRELVEIEFIQMERSV